MLHANLVSVFLQMRNSASLEVRASTPLASQAFPQLSVGQAVTATIVAQHAKGLALADLGGKPIQLALPVTVVPGETLSLRVLRVQPDFAFELMPRFAPGSGTASDPASYPLAALSQGARIIRLALGDTQTKKPAQPLAPSGPLSSPEPLLPSGPQVEIPARALSARQLATALQGVVEHSGLFYESHLAAWTRGRHTLAELRREPQAKLSSSIDASAAQADGKNVEQACLRLDAAVATRGAARARASDELVRVPARVFPEEAAPILRQQLETLETRQIAWQGQVWPGQIAALALAEESAENSPREGETRAQPSWRTILQLALPQLGGIRAELVARGDTVDISICAPKPDSARLLQSGLPALDERLRTAGLQPLCLRVTSHG